MPAITTGLIADISAVVLLVTSESVRSWLHRNWIIGSSVSLILFLATLILANQFARSRIQSRLEIVSLTAEIERLTGLLGQPTSHDVARFQDFMGSLGPSLPTLAWLKEGFTTTSAPTVHFDVLESVQREYRRDPRGYDHQQVDLAWRGLRSGVDGFLRCVNSYMWTDIQSGGIRLEMPREWDYDTGGRGDLAMRDINQAWDSLISAYDHFLRVAQSVRLSA